MLLLHSLCFLFTGRGRFGPILQGLTSDDESLQLEAVLELNDILCMATEESLGGFQVDRFATALINLLNLEHNPNLMCMHSSIPVLFPLAFPSAAF